MYFFKKSRLLSNIFYCFCMFVNKHFIYISGVYNSKSKLFYNAEPSAYYFYVKTIISVDFQIYISAPLIFSVTFVIFWKYIRDNKDGKVMSFITVINFNRSHTWTLIKYWHINDYLMENAPIYCRIWNIFEYIKEILKQVRVTLCRTDVLLTIIDFWSVQVQNLMN